MSKKLDTASVINELRGESAFFRPPVGPSGEGEMRPSRHDTAQSASKRIFPPLPALQETSQPFASTQPDERSTGRAAGRETVRHGFEFYRDQIRRLKEMRRQALIENQKFSMSEIVRTALDQYLAKLEASDRPPDRPVERPTD